MAVVVSAELVYAVACATLKPSVLSASSLCGPLAQVFDVHSWRTHVQSVDPEGVVGAYESDAVVAPVLQGPRYCDTPAAFFASSL